MFSNHLLDNYNATVCVITMRESSNSVDSKSFKPAMNIGTLLEPRNGVQKLNKTTYAME